MDTVKVASDYFKSSQNILLIPNREFGSRKFIHVGSSSPNVNVQQPLEEKQEEKRSSKGELWLPSTFTRWLSAHRDRAMPSSKSLNKQWIHPPDVILNSSVTYNVKFLGEVEVMEPKGTSVVREAIRKMKFNYQIKKSEGEKLPKVDIVISVDNVRIQDPKSKIIKHQYPLHRISYCADEKTDSRVFTFIAKAADSNQHFCYGFDSDKCSQDITLTVGQAFDLAYRRYLDNENSDKGRNQQLLLLQTQVKTLQQENDALKSRICDLEQLKDHEDINLYKLQNNITNLSSVTKHEVTMNKDNTTVSALNNEILMSRSIVGRKLENLVYDDGSSPVYSSITRSPQQPTPPTNNAAPILSPPPSSKPRSNKSSTNGVSSPTNQSMTDGIFGGAERTVDAFGMEAFAPQAGDLDRANQEYSDMQTGFREGLSFGTDDFSLADLDPLNS